MSTTIEHEHGHEYGHEHGHEQHNSNYEVSKEHDKTKDGLSCIILTCKLGRSVNEKDTRQFLDLMDKFSEKKIVFKLLVDTRECKTLTWKLAILVVRWMKENRPKIHGIIVGSSIII